MGRQKAKIRSQRTEVRGQRAAAYTAFRRARAAFTGFGRAKAESGNARQQANEGNEDGAPRTKLKLGKQRAEKRPRDQGLRTKGPAEVKRSEDGKGKAES